MGFSGSSLARKMHALTELPDPNPIDEIDYEQRTRLRMQMPE